MVLTGPQIRAMGILSPHVPRTTISLFDGITGSYGESFVGYDIRLAQRISLIPGFTFLASSFERFTMPTDVVGEVKDKSTWARRGVAVQNTVIEPGWEGYLTLELTWSPLFEHPNRAQLLLEAGWPIAQVLFTTTSGRAQYAGKYQHQGNFPQVAL